MVIANLIVILPTNLIIIFSKTKFFMKKLDCLGISSYYEELPRGEKDGFVRDVAEAIGQSTSNVRLKMKNGRWGKTEVPTINEVIERREG